MVQAMYLIRVSYFDYNTTWVGDIADRETVTLKTVGIDMFPGEIDPNLPFTAHPHVRPSRLLIYVFAEHVAGRPDLWRSMCFWVWFEGARNSPGLCAPYPVASEVH
jgi:hypothetical protein